MLRAILFLILVVPPLVVFKLLLALLGLVMVPIGLINSKIIDPAPPYEGNRTTDEPWQFEQLSPKLLDNIWGSAKYGAQGNWFWNDNQDNTAWWPKFNWLALRNPVSNLEYYFPWYELKGVVNNDIRFIGDDAVFDSIGGNGIQLSWYGWMAGFHYVHPWGNNRCLRIRYGFKFQPNEKDKISSPSLTMLIAPWTDFK